MSAVTRATHSLLAALVSTTIVVTAALGWAGWRLLVQQRAIDEQRARDRLESTADAMAAGIRGRLAEAGERLSGWLSNPSGAPPSIDAAVVVTLRRDNVEMNPAGGLPFVPVAVGPPTAAPEFTALETLEFAANQLTAATDGYRQRSRDRDPAIRAGALLRLGRVLRKANDFRGALAAYQQLATLGAVRTADLPSELAGLDGQQAVYRSLADAANGRRVAALIADGLDSGRWLVTRGTAEFYRDRIEGRPRPSSWLLAAALHDVLRELSASLPPRGQRVVRHDDSVVVIWRSNGTQTAALTALADRFVAAGFAESDAWQLVDPEGRTIGGRAAAPPQSSARIIGNAEYPWTLRVWAPAATLSAAGNTRTVLLAMMAAMLAFVWGASYFIARAIRREAAVARLQSDFVAAVSHEFRTPLTSVRQMAEMLESGRIPSEERRQRYYRLLAGEAARLQRLVETLLNFGQIEAGAERYRFVDLDAAVVVRQVVAEIEPHARDAGKVIELDGPDTGLPVHADGSALAVVVRNLIDNAIKYSPEQPTVWVQWRQHADRAAISVVDRGVGIPRSEQREVFRKFVRGRAAIDANIKGTGVGLSMVQQIVAAHGGEIRLDSEPGRGSTFTLLLPAVHRS